MKANRRVVMGEDAVSPVIAVILMVAITVVLAATVYLWVSGFGSHPGNIVQASFAAKAVDDPIGGDSDSNDDTIQLTFVSGPKTLTVDEVTITVDGQRLTNDTSGRYFPAGVFAASKWCASNPGGDLNTRWERGGVVYIMKASSTAAAAADCDASRSTTTRSSIVGIHQISVSVQGQVVLDASIEVHDNGTT